MMQLRKMIRRLTGRTSEAIVYVTPYAPDYAGAFRSRVVPSWRLTDTPGRWRPTPTILQGGKQ
jgi:hypothetical protein